MKKIKLKKQTQLINQICKAKQRRIKKNIIYFSNLPALVIQSFVQPLIVLQLEKLCQRIMDHYKLTIQLLKPLIRQGTDF